MYLQPAAGSLGRRLRIEVSCICLASSLAGMLVSVVFFFLPKQCVCETGLDDYSALL